MGLTTLMLPAVTAIFKEIAGNAMNMFLALQAGLQYLQIWDWQISEHYWRSSPGLRIPYMGIKVSPSVWEDVK